MGHAFHDIHRTDRCLENLSDFDLLGGASQHIPTPFPAEAAQKSPSFKGNRQLLQVSAGNMGGFRNLMQTCGL
jgi:hypothetical protein